MTTLGAIAVYFTVVLVIVTVMLVLSYLLGERHHERATGEVYESGMPPTGSARIRISVKYYLIAMFFVIFDLEAAFIYVWAVSFRALGWPGYIEALIFIGVLLAALVYLWRSGALEWGPKPGQRRPTEARQTINEVSASPEKEPEEHELVVGQN